MINYRRFSSLFLMAFLLLVACNAAPEKKKLVFSDFPNLKIGFSTQNFQKALPVNVETLTSFIEYASKEGYQFIELRDNLASLTADECKALATTAKKNDIFVIYEIQVNPLDSIFLDVFKRALSNTLLLPGPGILRSLVSKSEFDADSSKKGWTNFELDKLSTLCESYADIAKSNNVQFIVENFNEPFFGDDSTYSGLADLNTSTSLTGFQIDIGNMFRNSCRVKADPVRVSKYLSTMGKRWVTSHIKTLQGGESQPVLTDNPLTVKEVVASMGKQDVKYVSIELLSVADKQQCFDNHARSIQFMKDKGILKP